MDTAGGWGGNPTNAAVYHVTFLTQRRDRHFQSDTFSMAVLIVRLVSLHAASGSTAEVI
jgi:hypothetical protein